MIDYSIRDNSAVAGLNLGRGLLIPLIELKNSSVIAVLRSCLINDCVFIISNDQQASSGHETELTRIAKNYMAGNGLIY